MLDNIKLQHKILFAHILLMSIIGSMSAILLFDRFRISNIELESDELKGMRDNVNTVHGRITELATLGMSLMEKHRINNMVLSSVLIIRYIWPFMRKK